MLAIKNATVYTMTENGIMESATVLVENGTIQAVGKDLEIPADAEVIDAAGNLVFPGFIDAHCHLGMWEDALGFEGEDGNEMTDPVTPELRALDAINPMDRNFQEALEGGVTAVCTGPGSANVFGGQFVTIKTHGNRIDDMVVMEPAAMKSAFGENPKRTYHEKDESPSTRMAIAALFREVMYHALEYYSKVEQSQEDPEKKPDFDIKMEALQPVLRGELTVKAHVHRADDVFTAIRLAKEFNLKMTLDHCTEGHLIADTIAAENMDVIAGPSFTTRSKIELKNLSFETPGVLHKAGVKVAIMTDHPVIPIQYLPFCAALSAKAGMDRMEALKAITINAAEIIGSGHRLGSIETGKDADIVIMNGHPFEMDSNVLYTLVDGKVVYRRAAD